MRGWKLFSFVAVVGLLGQPQESEALEVIHVSLPSRECGGWPDYCYMQAPCPEGMVALGGGGIGQQMKMQSSSLGGSWAVSVRRAVYEYGDFATASAAPSALCAMPPDGVTWVDSSQVHCDLGQGACTWGAICPAGKTAISGGMIGFDAEIASSVTAQDVDWTVSWFPALDEVGSSSMGDAIAEVICADSDAIPVVDVYGEGSECHTDGPSCHATVQCPDGSVLVGGGFNGYESKAESMGPIDGRTWFVSWYPADREYGDQAQGFGAALARCAPGTSIEDTMLRNGFEAQQ